MKSDFRLPKKFWFRMADQHLVKTNNEADFVHRADLFRFFLVVTPLQQGPSHLRVTKAMRSFSLSAF